MLKCYRCKLSSIIILSLLDFNIIYDVSTFIVLKMEKTIHFFFNCFARLFYAKLETNWVFSGFVVEVTLYISHVIYFATELILTPFHQMFKLILTISKWLRISWIVLEVLYSKPQSQEDPKLIKKAYVSEWYISIDHQYQELLNIQIISFIQCLQHILKIYVYVQYIRLRLIKINIW